jgi:hypothetical protein
VRLLRPRARRRRHERRLLAKDLTIDLPADPSTKTQRLKIASVKDRLCKVMRTSGDNTDAVENGYQWLYRGESALNTHGGLDAIAGYVEEWQGGLRVVARRADAGAPDFRLVTAWALVLDLAVALWKGFGWHTADWITWPTRGGTPARRSAEARWDSPREGHGGEGTSESGQLILPVGGHEPPG